MGVVIESEIWEPNKAVYIFLLISSFFSILLYPARSAANVFDHAPTVSLLRFMRDFLLLYSLSSVMEGLWDVFGEDELTYYGLNKEQMLVSLCVGCAVSLFIGSFLGVLSDLVGHKKLCLLFYMLHLFVNILKMVNRTPAIWLASICLSLASSIFSFSFETWMVIEHDKLSQRQDSLNHMFWLMTFFESASFIGSQVLGNYLIDGDVNKNIRSTWNVAVVLVVVAIIYVTRGWKEAPKRTPFKDYSIVFHRHVICDKRIWLLSLAQASVHFSVTAFWILWAPTVVADGREVSLGLIYPCMLGSKMLGSTGFPWLLPGSFALRTEEYLVYVFIIMGTSLSIVAYDYQEIGLLVNLFCIFHACMGLVLPSLARLRTMYVPNEVRGGMMTLSLAPASAAVLIFLMLVNEYSSLKESTLYSWADLDPGSFFFRLGGLWLVTFTVLGVPIAGASFNLSKDPLRFFLAAGTGTLFLVSLIVLRIYLGWSYVGDRLLSAVIPYEETGWYDGQMWVKPPEILARDRLLGSYKVKPVIKLLKQTLVGTGVLLVTAVSLFIFATPVEDFIHKTFVQENQSNGSVSKISSKFNLRKEELLRLPVDVKTDDDLAAAAAEAAGGRPVYCRDRFYRVLAGGQYCKWEDLLK